MSALLADVRYAARRLLKTPAFAAFAVILLTIAIGANTAIFSLLDAFALRDLPVNHPEQLVHVAVATPDDPELPVSWAMFQAIGRQQQVFSALIGTVGNFPANVEINGELSRVNTWFVTGNIYRELGTRPFLGRLLAQEDDPKEGTFVPAAVIGYDYWRRRFGSDRRIVGQTIRVENMAFSVVGVAPPHFSGVGLSVEPDLSLPLGARTAITSAASLPSDYLETDLVGRLKPGITLAQARAQLSAGWQEIKEASVPKTYSATQQDQFLAVTLVVTSAAKGADQAFRSAVTEALFLAMAVGLLILLIACVNLAGLMLTRVAMRRREIGVRMALGASRWQVARPILLECVWLALVGATCGFPLASWIVVAFRQWSVSGDDPMTAPLGIAPDIRVLAFTALVTLTVGLSVAAIAIVWATRRRGHDATLDRGPITRARLGPMLVSVQMAMSLVLIVASGLLARNIQELGSTRDLHFRRDGVFVVHLNPRPNGYKNLDNDTYQPALIERIAAIPGVRTASLGFPPGPAIQNRQPVAPVHSSLEVSAELSYASPGFFRTLEIPLLQGRDFTWRDNGRAPRVAIVSQDLARRLFGDRGAIGGRIRIGAEPRDQDIQVIGVVADAKLYDFHHPTQSTAYVAQLQAGEAASWKAILIRSDASAGVPSAPIRRPLDSFGHEYAVSIRSVAQDADADLALERLIAQLAGFASTLALLLAAVGLYALLSHTVPNRRKELGIRLALGADPLRLVMFVGASGLKIAMIGIVVGIVGTAITNRLVASMLTGISPFDRLTMMVSPLLLLFVALAACAGPAVRATRVNPVAVLRAE